MSNAILLAVVLDVVMGDITLRQLEYFAAVAECGSMTAAAEQCRVTQAAVSVAVAQLEASVGAALVIRRPGQGVSVTREGIAVAAHARRVLDEVDSVTSIVSALRGQLTGRLMIGVFRTLAIHTIPALIEWFSTKHPRVELQFFEGSGTAVQEELLAGRVQVAFLYEAQLIPGVHSIVLRRERRMAVMSPDHPLASQSELSLASLAAHPAMLLDEEPALQFTLAAFAAAGVEPLVPWRSRSVEAIHNVAGRGLAYSILMQMRSRSPEGRPLVFRHIPDPGLDNAVAGALPQGIAPSALVEEALRAIRESWAATEAAVAAAEDLP